MLSPDSAQVGVLLRRIEHDVGSSAGRVWPIREQVSGRSVTLPDTRIAVSVSERAAGDLGSFAAGVEPRAITAHVRAYPDDDGQPSGERIDLGAAEAEAWMRYAFGPQLSDYAYQLAVQLPERLERRMRPYEKVFTVLLDREGVPMLAPDNYRWQRIWFTRSEPRKLEPAFDATTLRQHLAARGPYMDSSLVRDPRTDPDGCWKIDVAGDPSAALSPTARDALESARRIFRQRGAVNTHFQPTRLVVDGATLRVHFRWKKNPNLFSIDVLLPQSDADFTSPPAHNPVAWMSAAALSLNEELSTGLLLRARRQRVDGVIHLFDPRGESRLWHEFGLGITVPGYGANHVLDALGMNTAGAADAHRERRLISWVHVWRNNTDRRRSDYLGHGFATWTDTESVASVDVIEVLPNVPEDVVRRLVFAIVHDAADAGALRIVTQLDHVALAEQGFVSGVDGRLTLDVSDMK